MDGSMFIGTWWSLVPPLLAIVLAFLTKEVYSSLFVGVAVGALLYTGFSPWDSFVSFFEIMKDSMNLNILIFDVLLGMIIVLMAKSGGSAAYGNWAGSKIRSKKSALLATTGLGVLIFVDDYFNCLTVGSVMRPVTDRYKVSRAKLAYIIDSTAAPVCIIAPISSWAAAVNSYVPDDAGVTGFQLFLRTIPYNLYALLTLAMVLFVVITGFDFGQMKRHEKNAANGDLFTSGAEEFETVEAENASEKGKVMDLILPVAVLILSAIGAMIYTGYLGGATDVFTAFSGCDAETSLIFATSVTILFMLILYLPRKVITFKGFMDSFVEGFKLMIPAVAILIFAWSLKGMGDALGIGVFVENLVGTNASASVILPAVMFMIAIFLAFSTGTSWGTFAILVPIVVAMFPGQKNLEMMFLEYVEQINANIGMIDKNSTISVRGRSLKMLRIQVPDWETEREHFRLKLHDYFENIVKLGIETIEKNGNLTEFLGRVITTRKLYDDVVGIQNVKIRLYKIEAEREVPISWSEVSANSGGEGFLSAFVILTCLLSYMRRDETDLFTSGEEGKTLIMDNPFAQTNAEHLLKPLIEMAKKTNTQLICLSGLGGDSIYNRFDNIYVLKLVESSIRNGVQRVDVTHMKGEETKRMVLSEFKMEQMSLFEMMEE